MLFLCSIGVAGAADPADTVVVQAPAGTDPASTGAAVTIIALGSALPASADLATAVAGAPGVTVRQLGGIGDFSAVSIRGSTLRQVQVYLDGIPLNPDGASVVDLAELPLSAFSRVEVWRGNAPPTYAAAPIGGVIDLVTGAPDGWHGSVLAGSFGTERVDLAGAGARGRADGLVFAELFGSRDGFRYFDDGNTRYDLGDDHREPRINDDKTQLSLTARGRLGGPGLRVTALSQGLVREEGLPGPIGHLATSARLGTARELAALQADLGTSWRGVVRAWGQLRRDELSDPAEEVGVGGEEVDRSGTVGLFGTLRAPFPTAPSVTVDLRREGFAAAAPEKAALRAARFAGAASATARFAAWQGRFVAEPVLEGEVLVDGAPGGTTAPSLSFDPRLSVVVRPTAGWSVRSSVGRYLRPPDLTERFGDSGAMHGNPDLVPERGVHGDAGVRVALPTRGSVRGTVDVGGFGGSARDLITWVQNSQQTLVPINLGAAASGGFEGAIDLEVADHLSLSGNLTRTWSANLSPTPVYAGNALPRTPAWDFAERVAWREGAWSVAEDFSFSDGNFWDETNWYRSPARALLGGSLRAEVTDAVSVEFDAMNLLDRQVEVVPRDPLQPAGPRAVVPVTDFSGYPLPGRTVMLSVRWEE